MEEKLFGLNLIKDYIEVIRRDGHYFVRYDAGSHQPIWREDEVTPEEAEKIGAGRSGRYEVLLALQRRLGVYAYQSNWQPPD